MNSFNELMQQALMYLDNGQLMQAIEMYDVAYKSYPENISLVCCELGILYMSRAGNGRWAKESFIEALESIPEEKKDDAVYNEIRSVVIENLAILSLSYEEFYKYMDGIARNMGGERIVKELLPYVEEKEKKNTPWYKIMLYNVDLYYGQVNDKDPWTALRAKSAIASIYQVMLYNTNELKLTDKECIRIAKKYVKIIQLLTRACFGLLKAMTKKQCGWEIQFIIDEAVRTLKMRSVYPRNSRVINAQIRKINVTLPDDRAPAGFHVIR